MAEPWLEQRPYPPNSTRLQWFTLNVPVTGTRGHPQRSPVHVPTLLWYRKVPLQYQSGCLNIRINIMARHHVQIIHFSCIFISITHIGSMISPFKCFWPSHGQRCDAEKKIHLQESWTCDSVKIAMYDTSLTNEKKSMGLMSLHRIHFSLATLFASDRICIKKCFEQLRGARAAWYPKSLHSWHPSRLKYLGGNSGSVCCSVCYSESVAPSDTVHHCSICLAKRGCRKGQTQWFDGTASDISISK